jgi:hypothetical protein
VNTSNVVLKATVRPEWRKIFEAEDSDLSLLWRLSHIVGRSKSDIRPTRSLTQNRVHFENLSPKRLSLHLAATAEKPTP